MVGFDAGTEALAVLAEAADLARRLDAQVTVVHAVDLRDYPVDPDASDWEEKLGPALASEQQAAAALLTETNLTWSYRLFRGDPAAALIEAAEEEDALMIVVGNRGDGWISTLEHLLSPSISHRLVRRGHRPVLVVHPGHHA